MSEHLDDILLKIVGLRIRGLDSEAIGKEINYSPKLVEYVENTFKNTLLDCISQGKNWVEIAQEIKVSPAIVLFGQKLYVSQEMNEKGVENKSISFAERGEQVKKLYDSGKSRNEIALELEISKGSVRIYGYGAGINWPKKRVNGEKKSKRNLEEVASEINGNISLKNRLLELSCSETKIVTEIRDAIANGAYSITNIMEKTNYPYETIRKYAKMADIELPKWGRSNVKGTQIANEIRDAIANGAYSITNIMEKTNYSYSIIRKYAEMANIELPKGNIFRIERADLNLLIEQGLSLKEIGRVYGVGRERARQIIKAHGKKEVFKTNRNMQTKTFKKNERNKVLEEILGHITERTKDLVKKEGWAYEKALEYLDKPRQNLGSRLVSHSFDDLLAVFEKYEDAQKTGQKLSLMELAEGSSYHFVQVGKVLNAVGVSPMKRGDNVKKRVVTPKYKKEAIKRSVNVEMPSADIAYFLGIQSYIVENNISQWGLRAKKQGFFKPIKQFGSRENHEALTYRLASEIYEARDKCKFNYQETAEVLDTSQKIVEHALKHRNEIEPVILNSLKVLYNDANINKPYKKRDF